MTQAPHHPMLEQLLLFIDSSIWKYHAMIEGFFSPLFFVGWCFFSIGGRSPQTQSEGAIWPDFPEPANKAQAK